MSRLERIKARGNSAIDRRLNQNFLNFFRRHAVSERAPDMHLDLGHPVQSRDHRNIDETSDFRLEPRATPRIAPAPFCGDRLERHHEIVGIGNRAIDITLAKNPSTYLQPLLEELRGLCVWCGHDVPL